MVQNDIEQRVQDLERRLVRSRRLLLAVAAAPVLLATAAFTQAQAPGEIVASKISIVDDRGVPRIVIGQDPVDGQRRSRSAGISIHDKTGAERGGMSTFDDGSVTLALDAPVGVGHPMRDRIGMMVYPNGSSQLLLLDNQTQGVVRLRANGEGGGGINLFKWDAAQIHTRTITFDGDERASERRGPPQ